MIIDPELDHDEQTQPGGGWPILSTKQLDQLAGAIQLSIADGNAGPVLVGLPELSELVRLYRGCITAGAALNRIGELGAALQTQAEAAELATESILKRRGERFEILLLWSKDHGKQTGWHCGTGLGPENHGMRWRGTFDEAVQIVRAKYGPKRGTEALIVVVVDQ
jgi:hypothetical protein